MFSSPVRSASATASACRLKIASTEHGCCVRVEGRGTMRESPAAKTVGERTLSADPEATVVFDLSACDYLDSTFLGCLMALARSPHAGEKKRFAVAAPADVRKKLLGACRLDRLIPCFDVAPVTVGEWVYVPAADVDPKSMTRHIMEAHRLLAEVDSPMKVAFTRIADELEKELASPTGARR
jgi:anti-anti-sigma regulatory factor